MNASSGEIKFSGIFFNLAIFSADEMQKRMTKDLSTLSFVDKSLMILLSKSGMRI